MNYQIKSMGATLDSVCKPAGQCTCCPNELTPGDWYYNPESPNVIRCQPEPNSQAIEAIPCNEDDVYTNMASGIVYRFSANSGMYAIGFVAANATYIIYDDISGAITVPENCTLIFQGGKFTGSLTGNYTTIEAGPVQIFDVGLELSGTFTNECAYPEWWGAKTTRTRDNELESVFPDCSPAIQKAFDSPFYKIEFATGFYLVENTAILKVRKHIVMQGLGISGLWDRYKWDSVQGTVLWTRSNITVIRIKLDKDIYAPTNDSAPTKVDGYARLIWEGGCIDTSYLRFVGDYTSSALEYHPKSEQLTQLKIALRGPLKSFNDHDAITPSFNNCGFKITNQEETNVDTGSSESEPVVKSGITISNFYIDISGFDTGVSVDFKEPKQSNDPEEEPEQSNDPEEEPDNRNEMGALTSIGIHGFISRCYRYISAPNGGLEGGTIDCHIQTGYQNRVPVYLMEGDFHGCYIDSMIWDYPYNYALHTTNAEKMRLGPRMLAIMSNNLYSMMMTPQNVSSIIDNADGQHNASVGYYDLQQLGSFNGMTSARNYMHLIDNDLLSYDKIWGQEDIPGREIVVTTNNLPGVVVRNKSPFDREGFRIYFTKDNGNVPENGSLTVSIPMPYTEGFEENRVRLLFLAIHLKSSHYTYFNNLRVTVTNIDNTSMELFDGPYVDVHTNFNDIVLPLLWNTNESVRPSVLVFEFTDLAKVSPIWERYGVGAYSDTFKFSVEGRFNIHSHNNIWSASGGDMGKHILRLGKPYLLGSKNYATISGLPSNASPGAIGLIANTHPVVKTSAGWMLQDLVGNSSELNSLRSSIGGFSIGQSAFNTTIGKPVWWNGVVWVDATGSAI